MTTYRRKLIKSGDVIEVEAYPISPASQRGAKAQKSRPAQQALNDRTRLKNLERIINTNFVPRRDFFVTLTFDNAHLPASIAEAKKVIDRYLQRLRRAAVKAGSELKWVRVTEYDGRYHYHLIISGVDPSAIMSLWGDEVRLLTSKDTKYIPYGKIDVSPLMRVDGSFNALAKYHAKHGKNKQTGLHAPGCKTWSGSRNLKTPTVSVSDTALTERKVRELIVQYDEAELLKLLKSSLQDMYTVAECERGSIEDCKDWQAIERGYQINDISGFYLYVTYVRRQR